MEINTLEQKAAEPPLCPTCNVSLMKIESCSEVDITYVWNMTNKEWEETDVDYCGATTVTYECPDCGWLC